MQKILHIFKESLTRSAVCSLSVHYADYPLSIGLSVKSLLYFPDHTEKSKGNYLEEVALRLYARFVTPIVLTNWGISLIPIVKASLKYECHNPVISFPPLILLFVLNISHLHLGAGKLDQRNNN